MKPYKRSTVLRAVQPKEGTILQAILHLLSVHPKVAWAKRMNTGALPVQERFLRFGFKGCSDIIGMLKDGRFLALEVKRPGKLATKDQQLFIDRVNRHHGLGACVHSIEEADAVLKHGTPSLLQATWVVRTTPLYPRDPLDALAPTD